MRFLDVSVKENVNVMDYISDAKLVVVGAAGAIGSNITQAALTMGLTPRVTMFDVNEKTLRGAAREICHCAFPGARVTRTTNVIEALDGADYIITAGGAPRRADMTRDDLLAENAGVAANLGVNIRRYCPKVKAVVIVFNPSDLTGLTTLVHSGLDPRRVMTLAALDSTRLQYDLAKHFQVPQDQVTGCQVFGEHSEYMAVFHSGIRVAGKRLDDLLGTHALSHEKWEAIKNDVRTAGKQIIEFRGRSSFQSPAHHAVVMVKAVMDGKGYPWPCGSYVNVPESGFEKIMMTNDTKLTTDGVISSLPQGTPEEMEGLQKSYAHLLEMREVAIRMGQLPPLGEWSKYNPHL